MIEQFILSLTLSQVLWLVGLTPLVVAALWSILLPPRPRRQGCSRTFQKHHGKSARY